LGEVPKVVSLIGGAIALTGVVLVSVKSKEKIGSGVTAAEGMEA
jgi:hypothetical protein